MANRSTPAIPGRDNVVPPRLLVVPDLAEFITPHDPWSYEVVDRLMTWTDIEQATGRWQGIAIAAPTLGTRELYSLDFRHAWSQWAERLNSTRRTRVLIQDATFEERLSVFGPAGPELLAQVTMFGREFFGQGSGPPRTAAGQQLLFWSRFFETILPAADIMLGPTHVDIARHPGQAVEEWLGNNAIAIPNSGADHSPCNYRQIVVLRGPNSNEQEKASCFPLPMTYPFQAAAS